MKCPICNSEYNHEYYTDRNVPYFQNKVYSSKQEALSVKCGDVTLRKCDNCGHVWNSSFDPNLLDYDDNYQNEEGLSDVFQKHLETVAEILKKYLPKRGHIIEIGCGKAKFLMMMGDLGYNVHGYDPAYEGNDNRILKSYYPPSDTNADYGVANLIILRHVLEHIQNPIEFLKTIAKANKYSGLLYFEVLELKWIEEHNAFQDIFYEHCNYFSLSVLKRIFPDVVSSGLFFGDQYCYMIIDLELFSKSLDIHAYPIEQTSKQTIKHSLESCSKLVKTMDKCYIWGAGAKGATFLRLVDPEAKYIDGVFDINPKKQEKYIAKTGHYIYSPNDLSSLTPKNIIIMNDNYAQEVKKILPNSNIIKLYVLLNGIKEYTNGYYEQLL